MIKNTSLFVLAMIFWGIGALSRHPDRLPAASPITDLTDFRVWVGIGALLFILSLIRFGKSAAPKIAPRVAFQPEELNVVAEKILTLAAATEPDVKLIVDYIIFQAIHARASDIHFDPGKAGLEIKFRLDGMMTSLALVPRGLEPSIINRLKVISNLILYKAATPQDGRIGGNRSRPAAAEELARSGLNEADFRIAFMPTLHGERIVIRILGQENSGSSGADLGMNETTQQVFNRLTDQPQGMIVLTGPTGSGKTTTIFAALRRIQATSEGRRSIATLEDPIEFELPGVNQSQVDESRDFTFQSGLRAILRQDPDVIMVGEIRDRETAEIAMQAGMTGHLLITTVHANSSAAAFSRLLEMGIPPYSLNSAITAVIAQRLLRRVCTACRQETSVTPNEITQLQLPSDTPAFPVFRGTGCASCGGTGYKGRVAIFEILEMDESIRKIVTRDADVDAIQVAARHNGMVTLRESALEAVRSGLTSTEEFFRVIHRASR